MCPLGTADLPFFFICGDVVGGKRVSLGYQSWQKYKELRDEQEKEGRDAYFSALAGIEEGFSKDKSLSTKERDVLYGYLTSGDIMDRLAIICGVSRREILRMVQDRKKHKSFGNYFIEIKAAHLAYIQGQLWDAAVRGEPWAVKSYLSSHSEEFNPKQVSGSIDFDSRIDAIEKGLTTEKSR